MVVGEDFCGYIASIKGRCFSPVEKAERAICGSEEFVSQFYMNFIKRYKMCGSPKGLYNEESLLKLVRGH